MFIDVSPDLSIDTKSIEAVEAINELSCMVYTTRHSYKVGMPKGIILSMIQSKQKSNDSNGRVEDLLQKLYAGGATPRP